MHGAVRTWATRSGVVGHVAGRRLHHHRRLPRQGRHRVRPEGAVGIDGALLKLVERPDEVLLGLVAAGLVAYALYCLVEARYREI